MDVFPIPRLAAGLLLLALCLPAMASPPHEARLFVDREGAAHLPDSGVYRGDYLDGLFHGQGELRWRNGDRYVGGFRRGLMFGQGRLEEANGGVYQGEFRDGMSEGRGVYTGPDGIRYEGEFARDIFEGQGRFTDSDGTVYEGRFHRGQPDGPGTIEFGNGVRYEGDIRAWQMHGQGTYTLKGNMVYSGQFVEGVLDGKGEIRRGKTVYTGQIRDWQAHGQGSLLQEDGSRYAGEFRQGMFHGQGRLVSRNGDVYTGQFENGLKHGHGVLVLAKPRGHKRRLTGWWRYGLYQGESRPQPDTAAVTSPSKPASLDAEAIYYAQPELLEKKLRALQPSRPGVTDLYMISFGAYGQQDVFMKEARFSQALFDRRLGAAHRSLSLINNPAAVVDTPLASVTNLQRSLEHVAGLMGEEDILFLYLTSHGSDKHELAVSLRGLPLNDLPASRLAEILKNSGIQWKVVVISACYSGGFIEPLEDDHTLVITSARPDHVSFGCSDEAEFTYFGRAYFKHALNETTDFVAAFEQARNLVAEWEDENDYDHSRPQIRSTPAIEAKLADWRHSLPGDRTARLH